MNKNSTGIISVLIPTYNAERYLSETIESVLSQKSWPLEIIVVDDGSTDQSAEVATSFGETVRCVRRPHMGLAATRNAAMAVACGEYFLHLDADDLLTTNSIELRMQAFASDPSLDGVVGRFTCFYSPELDDEQCARFKLPAGAQQGHLAGASIMRAAVFTRLGGLDESLDTSADLDWFIRAREAGIQLLSVPDIVYHRRIHGSNMSLTMKQVAVNNHLQVLKRSLDRRRQSGDGSPLPRDGT